MGNPFEGWKIRSYINPYRKADIACEKWLAGQLWGNPIVLSPNQIHVYGLYLRDWSRVYVEFTDIFIKVVIPKKHD